MDIINDIKNYLANPDMPITREWLDEAQKNYPYYTLPAILFLKQNGIEEHKDVLERLAIISPNRKDLALMLGRNAGAFADFYPAEAPVNENDTEGTIDRFLDAFGSNNPKEVEALNQLIFNPTPDYADILAAQEQKEGGTGKNQNSSHEDDLINKFIASASEKEKEAGNAPQPHVEQHEAAEIAEIPIEQPTVQDNSMLSESLAKMYISRHKYSKALEILENINLNFPEKSIYFADQIRFLRKLVLNEKNKKQD